MSSYFQLGASGRWSCRDCGSDWCVEELEQAEADDMARAEAATAPDEVKSEQ
jgi:transposase-like protein